MGGEEGGAKALARSLIVTVAEEGPAGDCPILYHRLSVNRNSSNRQKLSRT